MNNINMAYYKNNTFCNLFSVDKKDYYLIFMIKKLVVTKETIDILLLCHNVSCISLLLQENHPVIIPQNYFYNTVTSLLPSEILIRYNLDIVLTTRTNATMYAKYKYKNEINYFTYNDTIKLYYFKYGVVPKCRYLKIISGAGDSECQPINNLHQAITKIIIDYHEHKWYNYSYGLKKLVTEADYNCKIPYKCRHIYKAYR